MIIVKNAVNFHGLYIRNTPRILKAAHNKSPARLSEAYLCIVYFCGDILILFDYIICNFPLISEIVSSSINNSV